MTRWLGIKKIPRWKKETSTIATPLEAFVTRAHDGLGNWASRKSGAAQMIPVDSIPNREQRLRLAQFMTEATKLVTNFFFDGKTEWAFQQEAYIAYQIWMAHLQGHPLTAHQLSRQINMPRSSLQRKLDFLERQGLAERLGTRYVCSDRVAGNPRTALRLIDMMSDTLDDVRAMSPDN